MTEVRVELRKGASLGPYAILGSLGSGGMGEVYLARDTRLDREVALKVLPPAFANDEAHVSRFEREAKTLASLSHPNILAIHDYGRHGGFYYLATERLEGMTLSEDLASGPLSPRAAVKIGIQVAQALAAAHDRGIVHRDLKPSNVFLTRDGRIKVLDFGLARVCEQDLAPSGEASRMTTRDRMTSPGTMLGTVGYMAPEQVRGKMADTRADVFSLGVLLYEMLAGVRPFQGRSEADVIASVLKEDPPTISQAEVFVPPVLEILVRKCLQKDPDRRYRSGLEVCQALQSISTDVSKFPTPPPRPARRSLAVPLTGGIFAVLIIFGGVLFFWLRAGPIREETPRFQSHAVTTPPGWFSEAAVSPDGTAVAFVSETEKGSDIFVQDIRGGAPIRLVSDGASNRDPAWFPDGRALAYTSEKSGKRSIWKVPRFGGAPVPILANACQPAISPDGKHIAFVQSTPGLSSRIAVAGLAAPGDVRVLTDKDGGLWEHENPAWSPDSKLICYNDHNDLWLVPARGGRARKLTDDDPNDYCPVWSPDGRHIYFCSTREGTTAIWRIRTGGGAPERVTTGSSSERNPSLSGDGRCLVYDTRAKMAGSIIDRRTGERRPLPQRDYFGEPALSPDGAAVVYCADLEGRLNLWRVRLNDGKPTGWPEKLLETDGMCSNTAWSPDGKWIAYQRMLQEKREVWVIPAAGGTPVQFSGDGGMNAQPEWSPDGRTISFISNRSGTYEIWAAPFKDGARAGEAVQLTHGEDVWGSHCWSPRGDRIAYLREDREGSDLWVMSVTGNTRPRRLTHRAGAVFASWDKASGKILVSAFWGGNRQVVKAVSPEGGGIEPAPNTAPSDPRSGVLEIEASADGRLFAVMERMAGGGVWALQAEKGAF